MSEYKIYQLFCDNCNWKRILDHPDKIKDLIELKVSQIQEKLPKVGDETPKYINQKKKFRCPKCGFAIIAKQIQDVQKQYDAKVEMALRVEERRKLEESIRDNNRRLSENRTDGSQTGTEGSPIS